MSDKVTLTESQRDELIKQYVQLHVDSMDMESLEQFVIETLKDDYHNLSEEELKIEIECTHDEELYDELVDNVTNEITQPKVTITSQELEGDISTVRDSDYADKVDTLVSNMKAHNDKEFTHDSEGC